MSGSLDRSRDLLQADLRHLIVVVDVAHPERPAIVAGERDLVRAWKPDRRLMREGKRRVRGDRPDRRARAEDAQERGVEDLEERRARVRRIEELRERALAERPVVPERGKGARVDELRASSRRSGTGPVAGSAGSAKAECDGRGFVGEEMDVPQLVAVRSLRSLLWAVAAAPAATAMWHMPMRRSRR